MKEKKVEGLLYKHNHNQSILVAIVVAWWNNTLDSSISRARVLRFLYTSSPLHFSLIHSSLLAYEILFRLLFSFFFSSNGFRKTPSERRMVKNTQKTSSTPNRQMFFTSILRHTAEHTWRFFISNEITLIRKFLYVCHSSQPTIFDHALVKNRAANLHKLILGFTRNRVKFTRNFSLSLSPHEKPQQLNRMETWNFTSHTQQKSVCRVQVDESLSSNRKRVFIFFTLEIEIEFYFRIFEFWEDSNPFNSTAGGCVDDGQEHNIAINVRLNCEWWTSTFYLL